MTLPEARAITNSLAKWLAAITSLLFAFSRFLPSGRPSSYGFIETAWIQMLHFAFAKRLQFGQDIVFTLGPWGVSFTANMIRRRIWFQSLCGLFSPLCFGGQRGALSLISSKIHWFVGCG